MTTLAEVNETLKKRGTKERIRRGSKYFYVSGGESCKWPATNIYVNSLMPFTVEQIIEEIDLLRWAGR